ncbi:hypothetical protein EYF80_049879 [Liparis tanakae]|uniref:Uncharacterized protein n=1 Tax=Liparis tanakae TaxID=230148 RepID=A0A4Z2FI35_9TELE|nr:hypothetical protein EYF80_049879 [Liparis tanakae]
MMTQLSAQHRQWRRHYQRGRLVDGDRNGAKLANGSPQKATRRDPPNRVLLPAFTQRPLAEALKRFYQAACDWLSELSLKVVFFPSQQARPASTHTAAPPWSCNRLPVPYAPF